MERIDFGPFCLDLQGARLLRDGVAVELRPQAFYALKTLIQNCGRHVDYARMIEEAWSGVFVSRHTVAVTVGEAKRVLGEYGSWIHYRPKLGYRLEIPAAEDLIRKGWHFARHYTREGFEKALECFREAGEADSAEFRAFEGMGLCYMMLGAYGMRPPREMYGKFLEAHNRTVALKGLTPELRADRAHAIHVFERRLEEAEAELLQVRREAPQLVAALGHLAMLYSSSGRFEEAHEVVAQAYRLDPLWPVLPTIEILARVCARQFDAAAACGEKAVDLHPYLPMGRFIYAQALHYSGQTSAALEQFRMACLMSPDFHWLRAHEGVCLVNAGKRREAMRILEDLERVRSIDYVDAYSMALLFEALGRRSDAFRELDRACEENSSPLFLLDVDPQMDPLRSDPRFQLIRTRVFGPARQAACRISA